MPKKDLTRLKQAFLLNNQQETPLQKNKPRFTLNLLLTVSVSVVLIAFTISFFTKDNVVDKLKNAAGRFTGKEMVLSEEIESLFLIEEMNRIRPLLKKFPITISGSHPATLGVNFRKPLNIQKDSIKVYFDEGLQEIKIVLKDYLYFSNSLNPIKIEVNGRSASEIGTKSLDFRNVDLNPYKINQLRLIFDSKTQPSVFRIKKIEVARSKAL